MKNEMMKLINIAYNPLIPPFGVGCKLYASGGFKV